MTERKAWELLSFVDQIHLWGVTDFRDFVIRHLKPWHEFGKKCYVNNVDFMASVPESGMVTKDGRMTCRIPEPCIQLPEWTKYVTEDTRLKLRERALFHMQEAFARYRRDTRVKSDDFPDHISCAVGACGSLNSPGYPLASMEEAVMHFCEIHGVSDAEIPHIERAWEERDRFPLSRSPFGDVITIDALPRSGVTGRGNRIRRRKAAADDGNASKRRRRG